MSSAHRFTAEVERDEESGGAYVVVPFDVREAFGRARAPVRATIGGFTWRTTVAAYGGRSFIGLSRAVREAAGVAPGDEIAVELAPDDEPRQVVVPGELAEALAANPDAAAAYDGLSFSHRREYAEWVGEAKRDETRRRRAARAVQRLLERSGAR